MKKQNRELGGAPKPPAPAGAPLPRGAKTMPITREQAALLSGLQQAANDVTNRLTSAVDAILAGHGIEGPFVSVGLAGSPKAPMLAYVKR